jgi:hypothetical protein
VFKNSIVHINLFDNPQVDGPCVKTYIKSKAKRRKTPRINRGLSIFGGGGGNCT